MSLNLAELSQTAGQAPSSPEHARDGAPRHWNPDGTWQIRPVIRGDDDAPRRPIVREPGNLGEKASVGDVRLSERYWRDTLVSTWAELNDVVQHGFTVRRRRNTPCDVALFPAPSGLVILDCDVKRYDEENGFVVVGNTATLSPTRVAYGLNDLRREVEAMGHEMTELATYAVKTKSGGVHLYFRENPEVPLRTTGHRHEWRVDVVGRNDATNRSWVATPPTPGYEVARDLPVAEMPTWLATWLRDLDRHLPPVGGRRRQTRVREAARTRAQVHAATLTGAGESRSLLDEWVAWELSVVRDANEHGGWNLAVYQCVLNLLDGGYDEDVAAEAVLLAAAPVNDLERRKATDTVGSAVRRHHQKTHAR